MKAILLAAGKGTRIARYIHDVPKSALLINDKPLIRRTAELLLARGISVVVCTGYHHKIIEKALEGLDVTFYNNPFYSVTNSIGTLWFAKNELNDDLIILNADVYFDESILDDMIKDEKNVLVAGDNSRCETGDFFLGLDKNQCIKKYGKELSFDERSCEYIGIIKIRKEYLHKFNSVFSEMIENGEHGKWWENVLYSLADKGERIYTKDYSNYFWCEIDYYDDYLKIQQYISKSK